MTVALSGEEITARLEEKFPGSVVESGVDSLLVKSESWLEIANNNNENKNQHRYKAEKTQPSQFNRPRVEENNQHVKGDKDQGIKIIAEIKPNPRRAYGLHAALKGGAFHR
ncbi:unnamed protein product, partial [marine sediment metagenome]